MKEITTISIKRLIAAFFLVVFLCIHISKLFHSHEGDRTASSQKLEKHLSKTKDCTVCDYHFVKDADTGLIPTIPLMITFALVLLAQHINRPIASIGLHFSDRGPPSLA